jgi:hypothetical protein
MSETATTHETLNVTKLNEGSPSTTLGKRKAPETVLNEDNWRLCKNHWRKSFGCADCFRDGETFEKAKCKSHQYSTDGCHVCAQHHQLYHLLYRPEFYDCGDCQMKRKAREEKAKQDRKREGIEKRKRTMAAKKLAKQDELADK